jgi:hypothetical protein
LNFKKMLNPETSDEQRLRHIPLSEEKRDEEMGYIQAPGVATTTGTPAPGTYMTTTTAAQTYSAPAVGVSVKQNVTPSPRHDYVTQEATKTGQTQQGGVLHAFATRSTGKFFFALHAAIVLFSFLVLVSSALVENRGIAAGTGKFVQYEVTIAQISFAVSLGSLVMERLGLLEHRPVRVALSAFQVFLWVPALVLMTFFGSFRTPLNNANGFFGAWGAVTASAIVFMHESERSRKKPLSSAAPRTSLLLLFFFSLMIMGSGIVLFTTFKNSSEGFNRPEVPRNYTVFSIAFGAITAGLALVMLLILDTTNAMVLSILATIFWCWIVTGVLILTFAAPFRTATGNGYYSCLFTLVASFGLLVSLRKASSARAPSASSGTNGNTSAAYTTNTTMGNVGTTPAAGVSAPHTGTTTSTTANASRTAGRGTGTSYDDDEYSRAVPFFEHLRIATLAGLVVMVSAILVCRGGGGCQGNMQRFEVAAGAVPLGLGLIFIVLELFGLYKISPWAKMFFAFVLLCWWIAAFTVLTFFGSFKTPILQNSIYANGFFFTWIGLTVSSLAFAEALKEHSRLSDPPNPMVAKSGFLLLVILGSAIELGAAIRWWYERGNNSLTIYALAVGCVGIALAVMTYLVMACTYSRHETQDSLYNGMLYLLTVWFAIATLVLTFKNGFWNQAVDNGFFSLYFTTGACLLALSGIWKGHDDVDDDDD